MLQQDRSYLHQPKMECDILTVVPQRLYNIFTGFMFLMVHPVECMPSGWGSLYHHFYCLGYWLLSSLVGITCFGTLLWCTRDGTQQCPPLAWTICGFCRQAHWSASQLFLMWYFLISLLSYTWPESLFATAKMRCTHLGAPHLMVIPSFVMFHLPFLHFLGQIISPMQCVLQLAYIVMVNLVELFFCLQSKL